MFYSKLKSREEGVPTTKAAMKPLLSEFLDNLKNVSESKEESVKCLFGSSTDLTRLDKWCRLELYVQVKECIQIQEKERKEKALVDVMCAFGTVISDAFTYEAVSTYISVNELTTEEEDNVSEMDNSMD